MTQQEEIIIMDFLKTIQEGKVFKSKDALSRIWDSYSTAEKKKAGKNFFDEVNGGCWPNIRINTHENGTATYIKICSTEIDKFGLCPKVF